MKNNMTAILIVVLIVGIVLIALYHKPQQDKVHELKSWFSSQLTTIGENLQRDIELDRRGHYRHPGRQSFEPRGCITYTLLDKNLSRFELSQFSDLTPADIESTPGYQHLKALTDSMGLSLKLEEVEVEGDGVETWHELDEFMYDIPRYYTITVAGWDV